MEVMLPSIWGSISAYGEAVAFAAVVATLFEVLLPGKQKQSIKSRLRGAAFWFIYLLVSVGFAALLTHYLQIYSITPVFDFDLSGTLTSENIIVAVFGYTLAPFAGIFAYDAFYYWLHRLQHKVPILWRFHSVHHSIRELNAVNNYHHVSEEIFRVPFVVIPTVLLFKVTAPVVIVQLLLIRVLGMLIHANTKLRFGPFKYIIQEPRYHRIHHSLEEPHFDKNFATYFPIFDVLFGTAYFPRLDEHHLTGLADKREPRSLKEYMWPQP